MLRSVRGTRLPKRVGRACPLCPGSSDIDLLSDCKSVVDLNPKIPDCAFDFRVTKEELDGA